jgi:hypothetical protein
MLIQIFSKAMTGKIPFMKHNKIPGQLNFVFMRTKSCYTPLQADPEKGQDEHEGANTVWKLAEQCWDPNPEMRPTAGGIQQSLAILGVKDDRPSSDAEFAKFLRAKRARQLKLNVVEIDYDRVYSVLQKVSVQRQ